MKKTDVAIIGGGVAGLSAAMYARRFDLDVTIFDAFLGGTIMRAGNVENYPGFVKVTGIELAEKIKEHAMTYKPHVVNRFVEKIEKKGDCFLLKSGSEEYQVKAVILATGTVWRRLNVPGEKEFENKGVHYCALCDGNFYKGKIVAMVGAGDSAVKDALVLSSVCKKVYIIVRKEEVHPEPVTMDRLEKAKNIEVIANTQVKEILGDKKVNALKLDNPYDSKDELVVDAIFINIGHVALSKLGKELGAKINKKGEIVTNKLTETNVTGFFAVGDVGDTPFKQAITGAAEGCIAAFAAYEHITKEPVCTYDDMPLES